MYKFIMWGKVDLDGVYEMANLESEARIFTFEDSTCQ